MMLQRRDFCVSFAAAAVLSGCGARGELAPLPAPPEHEVQRVLAATNRVSLDSVARSERLRYSAIEVAVPVERAVGTVPVSGRNAFSVLARQDLPTESNLRQALVDAPESAPLILWVHGYNNTAAEAIYRQAQLAVDAEMTGPQMSFVWPSLAQASGYVHDRDSVLQAREPLSDLIDVISRVWDGQVVLVAHSLGAFLAMDTLVKRQREGRSARDDLDGLILLQPDISMDVFRMQAAAIEALPSVSVVAASATDRTLRLSARLSQSSERVGAHVDPAFYDALGFRLLDVSDFADASQPHLVAFSSPSFLAYIRRIQQTVTT